MKTVAAVQKARKDPNTKHLVIRIGPGKLSTLDKTPYVEPVISCPGVCSQPTVIITKEDLKHTREQHGKTDADDGNVISLEKLIKYQEQARKREAEESEMLHLVRDCLL